MPRRSGRHQDFDAPLGQMSDAPTKTDWDERGQVRLVFTHFSLTLTVLQGALKGKRPSGEWTAIKDVTGLPSVFAKAFKLLG